MAVERFYSGDPLSASKFNRLVATVCNLRRKVNELKRRPKTNLLRSGSFARYPYSATCGCGCGWIGNFCTRVCVGWFPIYKPPITMHWKISEWNCCGVHYFTETDTLMINKGYWFRGNEAMCVRSQSIQSPPAGCYYLVRCKCKKCCGVKFVYGHPYYDNDLLPCDVWLVGKIGNDKHTICSAWSGNIYQPPSTETGGKLIAIVDHARFVANEIVEGCFSYDCDRKCRFRPSRRSFTGEWDTIPAPCRCDDAYMLFSGNTWSNNLDYGWFVGSTEVALRVPQLNVNIHGRSNDGEYYDGQTIYVCKQCKCGYTYNCVVNSDVGTIVGYSRRDAHRCVMLACVWIDAPIVPQENAIAFWGAEQSEIFSCTGCVVCTKWLPCVGFVKCIEGVTERFVADNTETQNWKFRRYIADIVFCKKEPTCICTEAPVRAVYSLPKKSTISETYYTEENCNGN